ncbi:putative dehydrogenase [Desulfocapsa sulfexigens DSM 10523]|uniref:Putative dehydrogenase n=2 Tax=Desulfocapsa TaxID=53318 RepID=M1PF90_DESSD|nr:putative dehydrogenase [Desulfocapsa sulfexigens DSM 10523]
MQQLAQKLKDGNMKTIEVPWPSLSSGCILVRNHYSLISAGTEGSTVKTARKGLIGKAKERPQQVKQVIDVLKTQGPVQTYRAVMKKLDAYSPLGYSCVGEVIDVAPDITEFQIGDVVACGGLSANHAEIVSVPKNLCVKVNGDVKGERSEARGDKLLKQAAYNTLGAIAMQGVRQADLRLGETCAVIGLGLLGQLSCLFLQASGIRVIGLDVDQSAVKRARENCADLAFALGETGVADSISAFTSGLGCDAVIITAATDSLGPINFAGEIARKKGKVIVSGAVPTGFDRDPYYYRKELDIRMSCSYGPGRYDINYEEKGIDYPAAYVRWTENRNMAAFQELIRTEKINLDFLTTHEFSLEDAPEAYDMVVNRSEPFLGILIKYDVKKPLKREKIPVAPVKAAGKIGLAFIGAGSYAQGSLLPNIPGNDSDIVNKGVMTSSGTTSKTVAEKFSFEFCTSDKADIFGNTEINTVFISTRHNSHAEYVLEALQTAKNVFVEKPLCLTLGELAEIENAATGDSHLMVGFNRRFAPLVQIMKDKLGSGSMSMLYRVSAGSIPADSWIQDGTIGGGRILGEVCHFIDFMSFMCGSLPKSVYSSALPDPQSLNDTVSINLEFEDGSIGTIAYFANGAKSLAKEYVEIYTSGSTGIIRDYKELEIHGSGKVFRKKLMGQDKGQKKMLGDFLGAIKDGGVPPITPDEIFAVTRATFAVLESLRRREVVLLSH